MDGGGSELVFHLVLGLILIYPTWRIFSRTGLNPLLSLLVLLPGLGLLSVATVLGLARWPKRKKVGAHHGETDTVQRRSR